MSGTSFLRVNGPANRACGVSTIISLLLVMLLGWPLASHAQQQQQGLCAVVKLVILQQLALERVGFDASLEITDNDANDPITDFSAQLTFEDSNAAGNGAASDVSSLFFVQAPTLSGVSDVGGSGVIGPTQTATIHWFIIPKISAGGTNVQGTFYNIGATLAGKMRGVQIPASAMLVIPAPILVKPQPQLEITYFQPRDVQGDDPFTPEVESPVPFSIGVLVKNSGYGLAQSVTIDSQQPKIVENRRNLLLIAQLLGARVADQPLTSPSLLLNLGDLLPGQTRKGAWDMITSLSGEFVEFKASYTHASELGGQDTSIIKSLNAYFLAHEVLDDLPGRDSLKDFLAQVTPHDNLIPDTLFESDGSVYPVNALTDASIPNPPGADGVFQVKLNAKVAGWGYLRLDDPGQAKLAIGSVKRSDGKVLNPNNYWTNVRYAKVTNIKSTYLNLFDYVQVGNYQYTVTYAPTVINTNPPITTLHFAGPVASADGAYYITPVTQMYFISDDPTPVSIFYSLTNSPFLPAYPFSLPNPGEYPLQFYAVDRSNNRETNHITLLVVGNNPPQLASFDVPAGPVTATGDALSVRPNVAAINFQVQPNPTPVSAQVDIFQGVVGWATVAGVPSSPTANMQARLKVAGDQVDFYRYQLDNGDWNREQPATQRIALTNLAAGPHTVAVLGRSQYGNYLDPSNAVQVTWVVDPAAPPTTITGAPATPSRQDSAVLAVGGANVDSYRWTTNNSYYRAETPVADPLVLSNLPRAFIVLSVLGRSNGVWQDTNSPTTVRWSVDPTYGGDFSALAQIQSVMITNAGGAAQSYAWDGRNQAGTAVTPGWYTVRLTVRDQVGRSTYSTKLVQVGELAASTSVLAEVDRGPRNPHARRRWAVWQDQGDGHFQIYARDLGWANSAVLPISNSPLSQENPKTDGRLVVWQARQPNGNWDIWLRDLQSVAGPQALTSTLDQDEINPAVDWPWVVYQVRPVANPAAPWLLQARNLTNGQSFMVSASTQDELDPAVQGGRVVWQDLREASAGAIYLKDLESGAAERRLSTTTFGQYHPAIDGPWIVWQDNRQGRVELYGYDLLKNQEVRLTSTPENKALPHLDGPWCVCQEDSLGPGSGNLRLIHLPSLQAVPLTRNPLVKTRPALAANAVVWQETQGNQTRIQAAGLPTLQAVFQNQNAVLITDDMAAQQRNAFTLLTLWNKQAGVQQITRYTALLPALTIDIAAWQNGQPTGTNFVLTPGAFLWVKFGARQVLDLGATGAGPVNLSFGVNVLSYSRFPSGFTAFRLLQQLGLDNARAVRMLDAEAGRWRVAEVQNGAPVGHDFGIPAAAVVLIDLQNPLTQWRPQ